MLDAILYDYYPNALPGELDDTLDLLRFWRMIEAKSIMSTEDERKLTMEEGYTPPKPSAGKAYAKYQRTLREAKRHDSWLMDAGLWEE